jgi:hypothetical protein
MISRKRLLLVLGCFLILVTLYGLLGFFQGIMLYTGARALKNANLWGSVFLAASTASVFSFWAVRVAGAPSPRYLLTCRALSGISFAAAVWILLPVLRDLIAIDHCLDAGGSFNYVQSVCDFKQSHTTLSLFERQGFRIVAALVFALPALLTLVKWMQRRKGVGTAL